MMDLREIIKWFIPCFHLLLQNKSTRLTFVCLFLLFNLCPGYAATSVIQVQTKNVGNNESYVNVNQSDIIFSRNMKFEETKDVVEGRTFGPRFKKLIAGLLPIVFQLGAASTWAVLAALVGVKTLAVALFILKLLLLAGAVKLGALFAHKGHQHWEAPPAYPQKEIHLHIHNGQTGHEEHAAYSGWNRNGLSHQTNIKDTNNINVVYEPEGPHTISTPYGNYVRVQSTLPSPIAVKK